VIVIVVVVYHGGGGGGGCGGGSGKCPHGESVRVRTRLISWIGSEV